MSVTHAPVEHLCPRFQAAMDVLARPWTGLIICSLSTGQMGFCELAERLGVIGDRMLSCRLKELESRGIVERLVISEAPLRVAYRLTELGQGFNEVARAIERWGGQLLAQSAEPGENGEQGAESLLDCEG